MNNGCNLLGARSTGFKSNNQVQEKSEAHIIEQILKKHSKVDVKLVKEITAKEVANALAVRKLIGSKQLNELEDKIFGKVMFQQQFRAKAGHQGGHQDGPHTGRSNVSEYSDQTFSAHIRQRPNNSQINVRPYNIRGGFMNASIFNQKRNSR